MLMYYTSKQLYNCRTRKMRVVVHCGGYLLIIHYGKKVIIAISV